MNFGRADYDSIKDLSRNIPDDEPVFLLRADDAAAPNQIGAWAYSALTNGASRATADAAFAQANAMDAWRRLHGQDVSQLPGRPA